MGSHDQIIARIISMRGDDQSPVITYPITPEEISQSEERLGRKYPESLKEAWMAVGYGFFRAPIDGGEVSDEVNCFYPPSEVEDLIASDFGRMNPHRIPGSIPFFHTGDNDYMVLVPRNAGFIVEYSDAPGIKMADSVMDFLVMMAKDPEYWVELLPDCPEA